ncbi:(2Fe-2S)-binding protein [Streptomyces sp. NPDC093225]|uniref:(2Fe-2S)-binding protein n=1 Tax=Streptomyces sp. NPDC093225 TaxID=3366034 RepID=UPI00380717A2
MSAILDRLAAVGPYFTLAHGTPPADSGLRPLTELYGERLAPYVAEVARRMGTRDLRVAASTAHLGLASRLCSLALGSAALGGRVLDLPPDRLLWSLPPGESLQLWLPEPALRHEPPPRALAATVLEANLGVLDPALRAGYGLSPQILRGNAASALVGALRVLMNRAPGSPYAPGGTVGELLGDDGPLAGTAALFVHDDELGTAFVRRSCCLYYRAPGGGLCGDCVLRTRRSGRV